MSSITLSHLEVGVAQLTVPLGAKTYLETRPRPHPMGMYERRQLNPYLYRN